MIEAPNKINDKNINFVSILKQYIIDVVKEINDNNVALLWILSFVLMRW